MIRKDDEYERIYRRMFQPKMKDAGYSSEQVTPKHGDLYMVGYQTFLLESANLTWGSKIGMRSLSIRSLSIR